MAAITLLPQTWYLKTADLFSHRFEVQLAFNPLKLERDYEHLGGEQ